MTFEDYAVSSASPPSIRCEDKIYHPNIDSTDFDSENNICVSLLDEWTDSLELHHAVMAILFLLYNPQFDDALSPWFSGANLEDDEDMKDMEENIRISLGVSVSYDVIDVIR